MEPLLLLLTNTLFNISYSVWNYEGFGCSECCLLGSRSISDPTVTVSSTPTSCQDDVYYYIRHLETKTRFIRSKPGTENPLQSIEDKRLPMNMLCKFEAYHASNLARL